MDIQAEQQEEARQMRKMQKNAERYVSRRNLLLHKKEDCTKNIRELGVLPEEAFEKYKNTTSEKVCTLSALLLSFFIYAFPPTHYLTLLWLVSMKFITVAETDPQGERGTEEVQPCEQEGF